MAREDAEGLRRRLYAPGASATDVERYRGLAARDPEPSALPRRSATLLVPVVVVVLVLGGLALARTVARSVTPAVVAVVAAPQQIAMPSGDREALRAALAAGDDVTVAAVLGAHRAPPALATATRSLLVEQSGVGTATVGIDPASADTFRGRATVLIAADRDGPVGWTTFRRRVDASGVRTFERQQQRAGRQVAGALTSATYRYGSGGQPVALRVDAPAGVRWAVEVVFTD